MENLIKFLESRHSVREYLDKPIEEEKRKIIVDLINEINQKHGTKFEVYFDKPEAFQGIMLKHWMKGCKDIIVFYHDDPIEAGYYSAQIMLKLQELGLASCYVGASYKKKLFIKDGLEIQCALAFGYGENQGKQHKNKDVKDILEGDIDQTKYDLAIKAALSAPTAMNLQRFKLFINDKNEIDAKLTKNGFFAEFDLGIVKYYVDLAKGQLSK